MDTIFTNMINMKKLDEAVVPYYSKFLIVILFGILNIEYCKFDFEVTTDCFRLIFWTIYMIGFFLTFLHTITILFDSDFKHLFAAMLMQFFLTSPFILGIVFIFFLSKEMRYWGWFL